MRRQTSILTIAALTLGGLAPFTVTAGSAGAAMIAATPLGWGDGQQAAELSATGIVAGDRLGIAVATSADASVLIVGSDGASNFVGAAYIYTLQSGSWVQTAKLTPSDGGQGDDFGYAVALSADGTTAVVGALGHQSLTGAVYVYKESGGTWSQTAELKASDGTGGDYFGYSIGFAGKTQGTILVGAPGKSGFTGAAYVFDDNGAAWQQTAKLTASDAVAEDYFGYSVGLSNKGSSAVVGAYRHNTQTGAAYVYSTSGGSWGQTAELVAQDHTNYADFGYSVSIDGPGSTVLVGALAMNAGTGTAYIFDNNGGTWSQTSELTASDGVPQDRLGWNVAISSNGKTAVVGAYGFAGFQGAAYVYTVKHKHWKQRIKLLASDGATFDQFGFMVAVSAKGTTALIGAPARGGFTGAAYVYTR